MAAGPGLVGRCARVCGPEFRKGALHPDGLRGEGRFQDQAHGDGPDFTAGDAADVVVGIEGIDGAGFPVGVVCPT